MAESQKLWGGRFEGQIDPGFAEFNNSFRFDRRLFELDVFAKALELNLLSTPAAEIAHQTRHLLKQRADRHHTHRHRGALHVVGDP